MVEYTPTASVSYERTGGSITKPTYTFTISNPTDDVVITVYASDIHTYPITTNFANCFGYSTNPTEINNYEEATLYFAANSGYLAPTEINVSGAEYEYFPFSDRSGGMITISDCTGYVYISVSCVAI